MDVASSISFEIFVQPKFSDLEVASTTTTLALANEMLGRDRFRWRYTSNEPGLINSRCGALVRAEPAVFDHNLSDFLIVVGGRGVSKEAWMPRVRAMQRKKRLVVLLSDAATAYIRASRNSVQNLTTHWADVQVLEETGDYPNLSLRYAEIAHGIVTSPGSNYSTELTISLIEKYLSPRQFSEIGSRLIIQTVRSPLADQPRSSSYLDNLFGEQVSGAIQLMERNIDDPISTREISNGIGLSVRQLERLFSSSFGISPGRYYRDLRVDKAHALIIGTSMKLIEVAVATGFGSTSSLASAYRAKFGKTPRVARSERKRI